MRQLVLVALLSAVASSALTVLLLSAFAPAPAVPAAASISAGDFKAALGDLEREVSALRGVIRELSVAAPAGREPLARPTAGYAAAPEPAGPERRSVRLAGDESGMPESATQLERFQSLLPRNEDGDLDYAAYRGHVRGWIFRGEREALEWFGVPTTVTENEGGGETWLYELSTGEKDGEGNLVTRSFWVRVNRGRVIDLGE